MKVFLLFFLLLLLSCQQDLGFSEDTEKNCDEDSSVVLDQIDENSVDSEAFEFEKSVDSESDEYYSTSDEVSLEIEEKTDSEFLKSPLI